MKSKVGIDEPGQVRPKAESGGSGLKELCTSTDEPNWMKSSTEKGKSTQARP